MVCKNYFIKSCIRPVDPPAMAAACAPVVDIFVASARGFPNAVFETIGFALTANTICDGLPITGITARFWSRFHHFHSTDIDDPYGFVLIVILYLQMSLLFS